MGGGGGGGFQIKITAWAEHSTFYGIKPEIYSGVTIHVLPFVLLS